jgi:hypothetical protein
MRLARTRILLAAGVLAAAATGTAAVLAGGAAASTASSSVVLVQCNGHGQVKPGKTDQPGCMPSQEFFTGLKWTSWKSVGYGSGTLKVNNCIPTCAHGKFISYPILTVLWRAEPRPGHAGQEYFSRLTFIFTGKRSNRGPAARTYTLLSS